jgi:hypothetical protein
MERIAGRIIGMVATQHEREHSASLEAEIGASASG